MLIENDNLFCIYGKIRSSLILLMKTIDQRLYFSITFVLYLGESKKR